MCARLTLGVVLVCLLTLVSLVLCRRSQFVCQLTQPVLFTYAGEKLTKTLRSLSFESVLRQDMGFFEDPVRLHNHTLGVGTLFTTQITHDIVVVRVALFH